MRVSGDLPAISDLTWLECRVKPIRTGDRAGLADMEAFLSASDVVRLVLPTATYERACQIRAIYNFKLADSLHLAAAIDGGCDLFLTNDHRLSTFPGLPVEVLP
jgi:predicted nucleic acid-binding protein